MTGHSHQQTTNVIPFPRHRRNGASQRSAAPASPAVVLTDELQGAVGSLRDCCRQFLEAETGLHQIARKSAATARELEQCRAETHSTLACLDAFERGELSVDALAAKLLALIGASGSPRFQSALSQLASNRR